MSKSRFPQYRLIAVLALLSLIVGACQPGKAEKQAALFNSYCASCHITPDIESLPKDIWANNILPEMAARMGIRENGYDPMSGLKYEEMEAVHASGIYPLRPIMSLEDWKLLKEYIVELAPDSLNSSDYDRDNLELEQFRIRSVSLDDEPGSFNTFLKYQPGNNRIWAGDVSGRLLEYDFASDSTRLVGTFESAVVDYTEKDSIGYITAVGKLDPSETSSGRIIKTTSDRQEPLPLTLHRPVNNLVIDLNGDGSDELIVSEFGHLTGALSLLYRDAEGEIAKRTLLPQPGTIRTLARDMDRDGKMDLIALTSQGDETITILYQKENLEFSADKVLRFSPVYGSSWFDILDFDGDGDLDIITVNGDNADKSYVQKPYHGLRIHLNDGQNNFKEAYFYSMNGATRFSAEDFDMDGDVDFAVISTFPDYDNRPEFSFVYLENKNPSQFEFQSYTMAEYDWSRWFLMDTGDVDRDGDTDIILSSFTYVFTPVPDHFSKKWYGKNVDLLVLENTYSDKKH